MPVVTVVAAVVGFLLILCIALASFAAGHANGWSAAKVDSALKQLERKAGID